MRVTLTVLLIRAVMPGVSMVLACFAVLTGFTGWVAVAGILLALAVTDLMDWRRSGYAPVDLAAHPAEAIAIELLRAPTWGGRVAAISTAPSNLRHALVYDTAGLVLSLAALAVGLAITAAG